MKAAGDGRRERPADIAASTLAVPEGYPTARSACQLARKHGVTTPVIDEVYAMLYEGKNVRDTMRDLMARDPKPEQASARTRSECRFEIGLGRPH